MNKVVLTDGQMYYVHVHVKKNRLNVFKCFNKDLEFISEIVWGDDDTCSLLKGEKLTIVDDAEKAKMLLLKGKSYGNIF